MTDELRNLLLAFGDSWSLPLSSACFNAFGQVKAFFIPSLVKDAVKTEWLMALDALPIVDNNALYGREFRLTDLGREQIGLGKWPEEKPVATKAVKVPQKELF